MTYQTLIKHKNRNGVYNSEQRFLRITCLTTTEGKEGKQKGDPSIQVALATNSKFLVRNFQMSLHAHEVCATLVSGKLIVWVVTTS